MQKIKVIRKLRILDRKSVYGLTFLALFLGDVSGTLQVVKGEDVLELGLVVHDRAAALLLTLLEEVHEELLDVLGLLVAQDGRQVLEQLEDLVLAEVLVGLAQELIVTVANLQSVAHFYIMKMKFI